MCRALLICTHPYTEKVMTLGVTVSSSCLSNSNAVVEIDVEHQLSFSFLPSILLSVRLPGNGDVLPLGQTI